MNAWVGRDSDDLVLAFGPPAKDFPLDRGGRVFEYRHERKQVTMVGSGPASTPVYVPARDGRSGYWINLPVTQFSTTYVEALHCRLLIQIGEDHRVAGWSAEGEDCY